MSNKSNKTIGAILNDIAGLYPYLLFFYLASCAVSYFLPLVGLFFYWPAFHIFMVVLGILSLLSHNTVGLFVSARNKFSKSKGVKGALAMTLYFLISFFTVKNKFLNIIDVAKITVIAVLMAYAYSKNINTYDFLTILFALISVLFSINVMISAGIVIVLLIACPILLVLKESVLAEMVAVYTFYFLVIILLIQIGRYWKQENIKRHTTKIR